MSKIFDTKLPSSIHNEGLMFVPAVLDKLMQGGLDKDYPLQLPEGEEFNSARNYAFEVALRLYRKFQASLEQKNYRAVTRRFIGNLLNNALNWQLPLDSGLNTDCPFLAAPLIFSENSEDCSSPCAFPVAVAPHTQSLDKADRNFHGWGLSPSGRSASRFIQEFLNCQKEFTWGMVSNGHELRLVRDNLSLTRPCYLSFNLDEIFSGEGDFTAFSLLWRLLHAANVDLTVPQIPTPWNSDYSLWEQMRAMSAEDGIRALNGLRQGVVIAVETLGTGFIQCNPDIREGLTLGTISAEDFEIELLHLAYRFLFLFVAEERELLFAPETPSEIRILYKRGYSMSRLRKLAVRYAAGSADRHYDLYEGVNLVFRALAHGEPRLGLAALGGIFTENACPHLQKARLRNAALLQVIKALRYTEADNRLFSVNYRDMGPEELGSVYEGLLEYIPQFSAAAGQFSLVTAAGNNRKTTGSYYTPDALVHELIISALDPVIQERTRKEDPEKELLSLSILDPACGSGHFLLAAARRLAGALISVRNTETSPIAYQGALREVVGHCIYGVDLNPLAVELTKITLWIESMEPGKPLSFLNAHILCGDATLGLVSPDILKEGIPPKAYDRLAGDEKEACAFLKERNGNFLWELKKNKEPFLPVADQNYAEDFRKMEFMPEDSLEDIQKKQDAYRLLGSQLTGSSAGIAADLYLAAFLLPKTAENQDLVPTSEEVFCMISGAGTLTPPSKEMIDAARKICGKARVLHWHLAFPTIFQHGGFDCILANPPWDKVKLQDKEFFASRDPEIAQAINAAVRKKLIAELYLPKEEGGNPELLQAYKDAKRRADITNIFLHNGGRFTLSNVGDINLYSVFAEIFTQLHHPDGKVGVILPTGICTDNSNQHLFAYLVRSQTLQSLYDFENAASGRKIFEGVHPQYRFCLLTLGKAPKVSCAFFLGKVEEIYDKRRCFELTHEQYQLFNPNTLTTPIPRAKYDIQLLDKIYRKVPVLWNETKSDGNPWGVRFQVLCHMSNDSHLFHTMNEDGCIPLYEAKMIHQFDHRWSSFIPGEQDKTKDNTDQEKENPEFEITPRYWVDQKVIQEKLGKNHPGYLMGWRDITNATNSRTVLASVIPAWAVGNSLPLYETKCNPFLNACLLADFNSLVHDWCARVKIAGVHLNYFFKKQIATLPPTAYSQEDIDYIVPRVLHLTYTSKSLRPWAEALGYEGEPFIFKPEERALLRAELDARYARLYGLNEEELTYILDPSEVFGEDYPSESFRVLKNSELKTYGEYRTARLVLEAFRKQESES